MLFVNLQKHNTSYKAQLLLFNNLSVYVYEFCLEIVIFGGFTFNFLFLII